jgi:hypothetical protein
METEIFNITHEVLKKYRNVWENIKEKNAHF